MSQETLEQTSTVEPQTADKADAASTGEMSSAGASEPSASQVDESFAAGAAKLVPVAESIKYRRRAQQAEGQLQQIQQQLAELQQQMRARQDELVTAEAKADELRHQVMVGENRLAAERLLAQCGVAQTQAAVGMLGKYVNIEEEVDAQAVARGVEQLLLDNPSLRPEVAAPSLPSPTAAGRSGQGSLAAQLASVAHKAATSGDRRDVIQYLRLRRQSARTR